MGYYKTWVMLKLMISSSSQRSITYHLRIPTYIKLIKGWRIQILILLFKISFKERSLFLPKIMEMFPWLIWLISLIWKMLESRLQCFLKIKNQEDNTRALLEISTRRWHSIQRLSSSLLMSLRPKKLTWESK